MSDYTEASFELKDSSNIGEIKSYSSKLFDACRIKDMNIKGRHCYKITISELELTEALPILDSLKGKFRLKFLIEYGVY